MDKFTNWEERGLRDLFNSEYMDNVIIEIAKIVSKNLIVPQIKSGFKMHIFT